MAPLTVAEDTNAIPGSAPNAALGLPKLRRIDIQKGELETVGFGGFTSTFPGDGYSVKGRRHLGPATIGAEAVYKPHLRMSKRLPPVDDAPSGKRYIADKGSVPHRRTFKRQYEPKISEVNEQPTQAVRQVRNDAGELLCLKRGTEVTLEKSMTKKKKVEPPPKPPQNWKSELNSVAEANSGLFKKMSKAQCHKEHNLQLQADASIKAYNYEKSLRIGNEEKQMWYKDRSKRRKLQEEINEVASLPKYPKSA
eukprot:NODE_1081_length_1021_cov_42.464206_g1036_i0.p1 GENE.NODE_1081_length_1021_cov_42.464206_g1036_i0~~NODE_1081_length_1021_cov_42.464206_g1036_i0.p1  ORF type:complete len:252 (+),score=30.94 NODE_1081_length_1021_cov_42.464206_g1036_i0:195-950(+)